MNTYFYSICDCSSSIFIGMLIQKAAFYPLDVKDYEKYNFSLTKFTHHDKLYFNSNCFVARQLEDSFKIFR